MTRNNILLTVLAIVAIVAFLAGAYKLTNAPQPEAQEIPELKKVATNDHTKWSTNKKNVLVEYADFQCPACKLYFNTMKKDVEGKKEITDNITFVYRFFPLYQIHTHAYEAAYAAEAAGKQGKFFEMGDKLFETQDQWAEKKDVKEDFVKMATDLKLDVDKFKADMDSKEVKERVEANLQEGNKYGVNQTPTFFLNGKKVETATLDEFVKLLSDTAKAK